MEFHRIFLWVKYELMGIVVVGHSQGRKFYGGIRLPVKKGRSQFHVAISNVATEISPAQEQVPIFHDMVISSGVFAKQFG